MDHLFQPLCIDTSITYELDMKMFPGLEDAQQLHEPSLLVWTTEARQQWLNAAQVDDINSSIDEDDLYDLIESCRVDMVTCNTDGDEFQDSLDDIIDSTSSSREETDGSLSETSSPQSDVDSCHAAVTSDPTVTLPPTSVQRDVGDNLGSDEAATRKRKHEEGDGVLSKRFKGEDDDVRQRFLNGLHDICCRDS